MDNKNEISPNTWGEKKEQSKNRSFLLGAIVGGSLVFVFCSILVLVAIISVKVSQESARKKGVQSAGGFQNDTVLETQTVRKILTIEDLFKSQSIYDIDEEKMVNGMLDGLVEGTGDKYAEYYTAEEIEELMKGYEGVFYGIGAVMFLNDDDWITVKSVYEDSPAEKAGVQEGDIIYEVDGESSFGLSLEETVSMIRGDKGTDVVLTIFREGEPDYIYLTITRGEVNTITVSHEMLEESIGYIAIQEFDENTVDQFEKALNSLKADGMTELIIDLRGNGGGLLDSVCDIARMMLPKGLIVYMENAQGERKEYTCDGKNYLNMPIVVLTNGYTASASEILTGALRDYGMAVTIGTNTYGKGVVQGFLSLGDGSTLKMTTAQYFTPNGTAIDGVGIAPDIEVKFDSERYYNAEIPVDNQLEEAISYLISCR